MRFLAWFLDVRGRSRPLREGRRSGRWRPQKSKNQAMRFLNEKFMQSTHVNLVFCAYLLLTEFEGRTVSYGPSFFPIDLWPKREACGPWIEGEKRGSVTYSTDRENEVSKIFIISLLCVWRVRERFPFTRNGFKFLTQVESKTSQSKTLFSGSLNH